MIEYGPNFIYKNTNFNPKKATATEVYISLTDRDIIKARKVLINFGADYLTQKPDLESTNSSFALIRNYKQPGTGLQFRKDKIAKGSIVVKKLHLEDGRVLPSIFYISDSKVGLLGEPMVYKLNLEDVGIEFSPALKKIKPLKGIIENLEKSTKLAKILTVWNKRWGKDVEKLQQFDDFLFAKEDKQKKLFHTIEVWKEGTVDLSKKKNVKKPRSISFTPLSKPIPQPI